MYGEVPSVTLSVPMPLPGYLNTMLTKLKLILITARTLVQSQAMVAKHAPTSLTSTARLMERSTVSTLSLSVMATVCVMRVRMSSCLGVMTS